MRETDMAQQSARSNQDPLQRMIPGYSDEPRPLSGYLMLAGLFNAIFAGVLLLRRQQKGSLPSRISATDLVIAGIATHKLSRLIAKDWVTSPLRAPFTEYEGPADLPAELSESPRGSGLRFAMGELLT
jgi:hypothetical protein